MKRIIDMIEEDFDELKDILNKCENINIETYFNGKFNNISFTGDCETDLYLRSSVSGYLTIVRIMFINKRCGTGTKVLEWLKKYAKSKGFKGIEVESTCTMEINNFCNKFGFEKVSNMGFYSGTVWCGNYRLIFK